MARHGLGARCPPAVSSFYSFFLQEGKTYLKVILLQVDAATLQYQNQKLVQQLDLQKHELHDLEAKIKELVDKQASYDGVLITVNQLWNQVKNHLFSHIVIWSASMWIYNF